MKKFILLMFLIIGFQVAAQKYSNTDQAVVTKKWNDNMFSSELSFHKNIEEVNEMSYISELLADEVFRASIENNEMITIFAPMDRSFLKYSESQRDSIVNYNNGSVIRSMIKYHIIPGRVDSHSILKSLEGDKGVVYFSTLAGEKLGIKRINDELVLFDSNNNTAVIRETDFYHSQGLFHIVDGMVFPENEQ